MTSTTQSNAAHTDVLPSPRLTWGWALKRTILAVLIIVFGMGAMAWLMHAATQPTTDASAANSASVASSLSAQPVAAK